jgi:hypothetical protein
MTRLTVFPATIFTAFLLVSNCVAQVTNTLPDGTKYIGHFKRGQPHGHGTALFPDGKKYIGEFQDGEPNGKGTFTWQYPNGMVEEGAWKSGKFVANSPQ